MKKIQKWGGRKLLLALALLTTPISMQAGLLSSCAKALLSVLLVTSQSPVDARVTMGQGTFFDSVMKLDNQGIAGMLAYHNDTSSLVYGRCTEGTCTQGVICNNITTGTGIGLRPDFFYDENGFANIVYENPHNNHIYLRKCLY